VDKDERCTADGRKNQMLKQVQHDMMVWFWSFCHPEPGFGISFFGFKNLGIKIPPCERGSLLYFGKVQFFIDMS
jgi:hypothetical protein